MTRVAGVLILLAILYAALAAQQGGAIPVATLVDLLNRQGFFGVLTLGVAVLIIAGGIDLSIGSVVGLAAVIFGVLLREGVPAIPAALLTLLAGPVVGVAHGLLVTKLRLQPFLVTLCGFFVYRGVARYVAALKSSTTSVGLGTIKEELRDAGTPHLADQIESLRYWLIGKNPAKLGELEFPAMAVLTLVLAAGLGVVLHRAVAGRYWYAIGYNDKAARYAGIAVDFHRIVGYVICSTLACLGGVLFLLDEGNAQPETAGATWELYAITGAVIGGCSLRGGEGTIVGIVLGAAVLPLLEMLCSLYKIPESAIPVVIGVTLLVGTLTDEFFRRRGTVEK